MHESKTHNTRTQGTRTRGTQPGKGREARHAGAQSRGPFSPPPPSFSTSTSSVPSLSAPLSRGPNGRPTRDLGIASRSPLLPIIWRLIRFKIYNFHFQISIPGRLGGGWELGWGREIKGEGKRSCLVLHRVNVSARSGPESGLLGPPVGLKIRREKKICRGGEQRCSESGRGVRRQSQSARRSRGRGRRARGKGSGGEAS